MRAHTVVIDTIDAHPCDRETRLQGPPLALAVGVLALGGGRLARRHYSDRDRAAALAVYDSTEGSEHRLRDAARQADVPKSTLEGWVAARDRAAPPEVRTEEKEALADVFERVARAALGYVEGFYVAFGDVPAGRYLQPSMTAAGIAVDKAQLLRGKPTDVIEQSVKVYQGVNPETDI